MVRRRYQSARSPRSCKQEMRGAFRVFYKLKSKPVTAAPTAQSFQRPSASVLPPLAVVARRLQASSAEGRMNIRKFVHHTVLLRSSARFILLPPNCGRVIPALSLPSQNERAGGATPAERVGVGQHGRAKGCRGSVRAARRAQVL
jgi:hypothetical protein